jgi:uncharacterized membrane protein
VDTKTLYDLGFFLVIGGIIIMISAILAFFLSKAKGKTEIKGGSVIVIGPFPIILGTDAESTRKILILSIILIAILVIAMVTYNLLSK